MWVSSIAPNDNKQIASIQKGQIFVNKSSGRQVEITKVIRNSSKTFLIVRHQFSNFLGKVHAMWFLQRYQLLDEELSVSRTLVRRV